MKAATVLGILLIVSGIVGLALGGFSYTHEKKDVALGPRQVSHKEKSALPISPILSTLSLVVWRSSAHTANATPPAADGVTIPEERSSVFQF